MNKPATYEDVIRAIGKNYNEIESSIVNQLLLNVPNHYPTQGSYRENVWGQLFQMVIPRKYCIEQGVFIIDSYGNKSKEVDLAIFDELYTPYIFNYGEIKFIPIEAVAAVVQCKSASLDKDEIQEWADSVNKLITSMDSVARMATMIVDNKKEGGVATQTATRPIKILCAMADEKKLDDYAEEFDMLLWVNDEKKKLVKFMKDENKKFDYWNDTLNHAIEEITDEKEKGDRNKKKSDKGTERDKLLENLKVTQKNEEGEIEENVIFSLIFQLNQLLMILNNPMLFPHHAYAERFTGILKGENQNKGENKNGEEG